MSRRPAAAPVWAAVTGALDTVVAPAADLRGSTPGSTP